MTAVIYAAVAGAGGLGLQAASAVASLATAGPVVALGPGRVPGAPFGADPAAPVTWEVTPPYRPSWFARRVVGRLWPGRFILGHDRHVGVWAAGRLPVLRPRLVYVFTQVGLEALEWARQNGVPTVLDSPNGHIRGFARVYREEWARWVGGPYPGHPTPALVERVEREYALADRIRVSSEWARASLIREGVPAARVFVCPQPIDLVRFHPPAERERPTGPLRVVYVGSLDLRKGFVYLLRAARAVGPERVRIELVGATGDRGARRLLARERVGLAVEVRPGDPLPAYHRAELFVLPSLEDGFGFVVAEAMACGLAVVVTNQCGAAEWVRPGETGWMVSAGSADALAAVLEQALADRDRLAELGRAARRAVAARNPDAALRLLAEQVYSVPCAS